MTLTQIKQAVKPYFLKLKKNYFPVGDSYTNSSEAIGNIAKKSYGAKRVYVPVCFDTEYQDPNQNIIAKPKRRQLVSKQFGSTNMYPFEIYSDQPRHLDYHPITELGQGIGLKVDFRTPDMTYFEQSIVFVVMSHFQTAELDYMFNGPMRIIWENDYLKDSSKITATKRVMVNQPKGSKGTYSLNIAELYLEDYNGQLYNFEIILVDTVGLHGVASYKELLENTGITTHSKDLITLCKQESGLQVLPYNPIENMTRTVVDYPEAFDEYSLGDLKLDQVIFNNRKLFDQMKETLGIPSDWYQVPSLTTGATVAETIEQCIYTKIEQDWTKTQYRGENKDTLKDLLFDANPNNLFDRYGTAALLTKTYGGRCHNNLPTVLGYDELVADMDMDGCYGTGQLLQSFPIGTPEIINYPITGKNTYMTLRQWLKAYKDYLVPGLWTATVDTLDYTLKYKQDFIPSWFIKTDKAHYSPAIKTYIKHQEQALKDGSEDAQTEVQDFVKDGESKIFTRQIKCGIFTHDTLQWLMYVCTAQQRNELLDNVVVLASAVFTKSSQCEDFQDWKEKVANHKGTRTVKRGTGQVVTLDRNHTYWFPLSLKELIIETTLTQRKRYPKKSKLHDGKKHPLNTLWKLLTNTTYGVTASPFFTISCSVVANNITGRARAFGWYYEKSCMTRGLITDGDIMRLNNVVYASGKSRINGHNMVDMTEISSKHFYTAPIGGLEFKYSRTEGGVEYYYRGDTEMSSKDLMYWLDNEGVPGHIQSHFNSNIDAIWVKRQKLKVKATGEAPEYLLESFHYVDAVGYFDWECKAVYHKARYHGASNYYLQNTLKDKVSMRAYKDSQHWDYNGNSDVSPAKQFLSTLESHIELPEPMLRTEIIKLKEYQQDKVANKGLCVGDTRFKLVHIKPLSLSQFKFETIKQFLAWDKQRLDCHNNYGIYLELFFMDCDKLDWQSLINKVHEMVNNGVKNPITELSHTMDDFSPIKKYKTAQRLRYDTGLTDQLYLECPECGSSKFKKNGFDRDGIQQYQCKSCGHEYKPYKTRFG